MDQMYMTKKFNSYIESPAANCLRNLCLCDGVLRHYDRGEPFFTAGNIARYIGYIQSGTLKYVAYGEDGTEHVVGLEFAGEFVTDFPSSLRGQKARTSVIAVTPCEIFCIFSEYNPDSSEPSAKRNLDITVTFQQMLKSIMRHPVNFAS